MNAKRNCYELPSDSKNQNMLLESTIQQETFKGEKLHEFRSFVAIREIFFLKFAYFGGTSEQSMKVFSHENLILHQFTKVFSHESFSLYGILDHL